MATQAGSLRQSSLQLTFSLRFNSELTVRSPTRLMDTLDECQGIEKMLSQIVKDLKGVNDRRHLILVPLHVEFEHF